MENFQPSTSFIGQNLLHLTRVDSTNTFLKELARNQQQTEGTVVVADDQFNGRGRQDRHWQGEPGLNVYASVFLRPVFLAPAKASLLNFAVSLAVWDTVRKMVPMANVKVKWPNDILLNGEKLCGILIENSITGGRIDSSVVGIGINVNQNMFPEEIHGTSMLQQTGQFFRINEVLKELCENLERRYLSLKNGNGAQLWTDYNACLFGKGETVQVLQGSEQLTGELLQVSEDGMLEMSIDGRSHNFGQGEIKLEWHGMGTGHR